MKKSTLSIWTLALALMLSMANCVKEDHETPEPEPTEPDASLVEAINKIEVATVQLQTPAPVQQTAGGVEIPAQTTALYAGIIGLTPGGAVPSNVTSAANAVSSALTASDINILTSVTPATLDAIKNGGAIPAELQAVLNKMAADPTLAAYLSKLTLPTVNGVTVGARTKGVEAIEGVEEVEVTDECINAANAVYAGVKQKLDNSRTTQLAGAASAYATAIAGIPAQQTACVNSLPAVFNPQRTAAETQFNAVNAALDANQASLGNLYVLLKAAVVGAYVDYLSSINELQTASVEACGAFATASTAAAVAARDANNAAIEAAYATALTAADEGRKALIQSCHNQGTVGL